MKQFLQTACAVLGLVSFLTNGISTGNTGATNSNTAKASSSYSSSYSASSASTSTKAAFERAEIPMPIYNESYVYATPQVVPIVANSVPSGPATSMKVTAKASCSNNNHVGSDWSKTLQVNGTAVSGSASLKLRVGDTVTVSAKIVERDDSRDDVGTGERTRTLTQSDIDNGFTISFTVDVTENGGRYSGNTATWNVSFQFQ